jgi:hypothetical protein
MTNKELIITLSCDLFVDQHLLKIYKFNEHYILSELKRVKKYYEGGIKIVNDNITTYLFEINYVNNYKIMLEQIKNSGYIDLIKNPSLTNFDHCNKKRIEITQHNGCWIYKKYINYNDDDPWILQFEGPCHEN